MRPGIRATERVLVTAGDATVRYFVLGGLIHGHRYPVMLRYDHTELPDGRVAVQDLIELTRYGQASGSVSSLDT